MDRWTQKVVNLSGGLDTTSSPIQQGIENSGSARRLINYEPLVGGGYRRVNGYSKFSNTQVTGDTDSPILGVHPFHDGAIAVRKTSTSYDIYYSTGTSWSKINSASRTSAVTKARFITYEVAHPVIVIVDGANYALRYTNSTDTLLNGSGAPSNPKYVSYHLSRLVLAGHTSNPSEIVLSAPNDVTDYNSGSGAIAIAVGDNVIGLHSFRNELYICGQKGIYKLTGDDHTNFAVVPVATNIGIVDGDTLQEVGGDLIYLSRDGFRTIAGTTRIGDVELGLVSRTISKEVKDMLNSSVVTYSSITIPEKSQYRLFYHRASDSDEGALGFIGTYKPTDYTTYEWGPTVGFPVYCAGSDVLTDGTTLQVFGHKSDGYVYVLDTSNTLDGRNIPFDYKSPPLTFPDDQVNPRKVLYKWGIACRFEGSTSVVVSCLLDEFEIPKRNQPPSRIVELGSTGGVWDGFDWDDGTTWSDDDEIKVVRINQEGSGKTFTLRISGSTDEPSHTIYSHILEYSVKGKR